MSSLDFKYPLGIQMWGPPIHDFKFVLYGLNMFFVFARVFL